MDSVFFHPKLVHLPLALGVLMPLISLGLLVAWRQDWLPARAWVVAVAMQAILLGSGFAASQSGEREEDRVEEVMPEKFIEAHEEAAETFVLASGIVLALMLAGLLLSGRKEGPWLAATSVAGTIAVAALGVQTGNAGGELVYKHGAATAYVSPAIGAGGRENSDQHLEFASGKSRSRGESSESDEKD